MFLGLLLFNLIGVVAAHRDENFITEFEYTDTYEIRLGDNKKISVTYHGFSDHDAVEVYKIIKAASDEARGFLQSEGFKNNDCSVLDIDFYDLDTKILNDRKIMSSINWAEIGSKMIYAYFDSVDSSRGKSSIFMTAPQKYDTLGLNSRGRKKIISHEMMHYWQDRTCNRAHDLEGQAKKFANNMITNHF